MPLFFTLLGFYLFQQFELLTHGGTLPLVLLHQTEVAVEHIPSHHLAQLPGLSAPVVPAHTQDTSSGSSILRDSAPTTHPIQVALTFDDGPHKELTPKLLDFLEQEQVHVTFFVLGKNATSYPDIITRAASQGNEIENHSWDHAHLPLLSSTHLQQEIRSTDEIITKLTGKNTHFLRPPYGDINKTLEQLSPYPLLLWNIDPRDWKNASPDVIAYSIASKIKDGDIILLHDIHPQSIEATKLLIPELKKRDVEFLTVQELLGEQQTKKIIRHK